jgi:hypothetical protein
MSNGNKELEICRVNCRVNFIMMEATTKVWLLKKRAKKRWQISREDKSDF